MGRRVEPEGERAVERSEPTDPQEERVARAWLAVVAALASVALLGLLDLLVSPASPTKILVLGGVAAAAIAVAIHRREMSGLERRRRTDAEGFARMLRTMSRSSSPEAIVESIAQELGGTVGADHLVVVHLRQGGEMLDATLFTSSGNASVASTVIPFAVGEEPAGGQRGHESTAEAATGGAAVGGAGDRLVAVGPGRPASGVSTMHPGSLTDRMASAVASAFGLKNPIAAPLVTPSGVVGAIVVSRRTVEPWPTNARQLLAGAAVEASAALVRAYSHRAAEEEAATDALTRLPNRRYFEEVCRLWSQRRRGDGGMGILMIDIDHFKALNDTFGHGVGDEVLREVAQAIARAVREDDVPARWGGEEFIVLLRDPGVAVAEAVGERVRAAVGAIDLSELGVGRVSVSVGVAVGEASESSEASEAIEDVIVRADRAMYDAKAAGRDRVVSAGTPSREAAPATIAR